MMKKINVNIAELPYSLEESLNRLKTNMKFSANDTRKILVSSSIPNEGKSFISIYLWKMLAESGFKTVLVDLDMRKSVLNKRHELSFDQKDTHNDKIKGISYYLSGMIELEEAIYETNIENGYMIPCINTLENPTPLLEDKRFRKMLDQLSQEYRYIIIDSPPLINVADGSLISSYCDGAVLVIRSGYTPKKLVKQSISHLDRAGCKVLGMVLNREEASLHNYGRYYYRKYYYYRSYYKYGGKY